MEEEKTSLSNDEGVSSRVTELWVQVMDASIKVLYQAQTYGFSLIEIIPDPNIHQMLFTMRSIESILDVIIDDNIFGELNYEDIRKALNARESIRRMEQVVIALKADNKVDFEKAIDHLSKNCYM